jgi:hypothetical protein
VGCLVHAFELIHKSKFSSIARGMVAGTFLNDLGLGVYAYYSLIKRKKMGDHNTIDIFEQSLTQVGPLHLLS